MKTSLRSLLAAALGLTVIACGGAPGAPPTAPKTEAHATAPAASAPTPALVCANAREDVEPDHVTRVEIQGEGVPPELCDLVKRRVGQPFDEQAIDADMRALWADGRVEDVMVTREQQGARSALVYTVRMRPRVVAFDVELVGDAGKALNGVVLERPSTADPRSLKAMVSAAVRQMYAQGYRHVRIDHEIKPREGGVAIALRVEPGPRAVVKGVRFVGPGPDRARELSTVLLTAPGEPLAQDKLERDVLMVQANAYDHGLLEVQVDEPEIIETGGGAAVEVVLRVNEGPVYRLGKVTFKGDLIGPVATYERDLWTSKKGAIFSRSVVAADIDRIKRFHESRGSLVEVTPETQIDKAKGTVDLTLQIAQRR
jgi:outer membrane protein insertion porin family